MRIGLIGCGDIGTTQHLPALCRDSRVDVVAVTDTERALAEDAARKFDVPVALHDATALIDGDIEAVVLATPPHVTCRLAVEALGAGLHVLCEKPMALNHAEACEMNRVALETGRTLGIAYYRRLYPKLLRTRELIGQGVAGRPVLAEINCHDWFNDEDGRR